jgi:ornithine decarboxylase
MSEKFGAHEDYWSSILDTCSKLKLRVRGVSFHVGSGGCSFEEYKESIMNAKNIFEMAEEKGMPEMDMLDIGGGFSMSSAIPDNNFDIVAPKIQNMLNEYFPGKNKKVRVIGEPGRYICQDSMSLCVKVFLAR